MSPKRKNILLFIIATSINLLLLLLQSIAVQLKISTSCKIMQEYHWSTFAVLCDKNDYF